MKLEWSRLGSRMTAGDWGFLQEVLDPEGEGRLWRWASEDVEGLRELLDLRVVHEAMVDAPGALRVSAGLYFYVLVRRGFLAAGMDDVELADYVAWVLADRATADPCDRWKGVPGGLTRAAEFIAVMEASQGRVRFQVQVAAGNQFLVLTGIFPEYVRRRAQRRGAPDLEFYESFGAQAFRHAADNPLAPSGMPRALLGRLAECFHQARCTLNRLSSDRLFIGG